MFASEPVHDPFPGELVQVGEGPIRHAVAHRPARSVIAARDGAIRSSISHHVAIAQFGFGHFHRCFDHTNRAARPNTGRSTSTMSLRP